MNTDTLITEKITEKTIERVIERLRDAKVVLSDAEQASTDASRAVRDKADAAMKAIEVLAVKNQWEAENMVREAIKESRAKEDAALDHFIQAKAEHEDAYMDLLHLDMLLLFAAGRGASAKAESL